MNGYLSKLLATSKSILDQRQHFVEHVELRKLVQLWNDWCPFCSLCPFGSNLQEASHEMTWILKFHPVKSSKWVFVSRWLNQNTFSKDNLDFKCYQGIQRKDFSPYSQLETDRGKKNFVIRDLPFNKPGKDSTSSLTSKRCKQNCSVLVTTVRTGRHWEQ